MIWTRQVARPNLLLIRWLPGNSSRTIDCPHVAGEGVPKEKFVRNTLLVAVLLAIFGIVGRLDYDDEVEQEKAGKAHVAWMRECKARDIPLNRCPETTAPMVAKR